MGTGLFPPVACWYKIELGALGATGGLHARNFRSCFMTYTRAALLANDGVKTEVEVLPGIAALHSRSGSGG